VYRERRTAATPPGLTRPEYRFRHLFPNGRDGGRDDRDDRDPSRGLSRFNRSGLFCPQWFNSFLHRFDALFAFDAIERDLFGGGVLGVGRALFGFVDDDSFKLFFFVKEIRNVKKRVAFESDVYERGLHAGKHAHHAAFVNVADDSLMLFSTFNVEL
jgi:hypothetical protein